MIAVRTELQIPTIILHLESVIDMGMKTGALVVAARLWRAADDKLVEQVMGSGGKLTGNLQRAMGFRALDTGLASFAQAEMYINLRKAPYAEWVELGKFAANVPYGKLKTRNYRNTKFVGHHFLRKAIAKVKKDFARQDVLDSIGKALSSKGNFDILGNTIEVK